MARAIGSYPIGHGFKSNSRYHFGPLVKRLRHGPFTAVTWVRFPYGSPKKERHLDGVFLFLSPSYEESHLSPRLRGIGFANLTKGPSVLARELLGKFSSQSEPFGWRPMGCLSFFAVAITPSDTALLCKYRAKLGFSGDTKKLVCLYEELPQSLTRQLPPRKEPR